MWIDILLISIASAGVPLAAAAAVMTWGLSVVLALTVPQVDATKARRKINWWTCSLFLIFSIALTPLTLWLLQNVSCPPRATLVAAFIIMVLPFSVWQIGCSRSRISIELQQTAKLDGASGFQLFRHATFPCIRRSLVSTALLAVVAATTFLLLLPAILAR